LFELQTQVTQLFTDWIAFIPVASVQIYFEGAKFLPHREGRRRAESGGGVLVTSSKPPPHLLSGLGDCCKLPQRGPGLSPGTFETRCNLRPQNSLQKFLIIC